MLPLRYFVLFYSLIFNALLFGQQLSPTVISSGGGFSASPTGTVSYTTGELAAVETYYAPSAILTQGFQQPWVLPPNRTTDILDGFRFELFPNPTEGQGTLIVEYPESLDLQIEVRDVIGRSIVRTKLRHISPHSTFPFDILSAASGSYILTLTAQKNQSQTLHHFYQMIILTK